VFRYRTHDFVSMTNKKGFLTPCNILSGYLSFVGFVFFRLRDRRLGTSETSVTFQMTKSCHKPDENNNFFNIRGNLWPHSSSLIWRNLPMNRITRFIIKLCNRRFIVRLLLWILLLKMFTLGLGTLLIYCNNF
jgi:hypothetical protein